MPLTTTPVDTLRGPSWTTPAILGHKNRAFGQAAVPTSVAWPTINLAILVPFSVQFPVTFPEIFFLSGTSPGTANFDLGIYRDDFTLLASLGATASVNTNDAVLPAGGGAFSSPVTLPRGRYYVAMSAAATSITVRCITTTNALSRAFGCLSMASAHPLPPTITPAQAVTIIPTLGMTTITNIL